MAGVLAFGGGGDGGEAGAGAEAGAQAKAASEEGRSELKPTLTRSQLIARADAICADSKETYKGVFSPTSEENPDIAYSQILVGISTRAVGRLESLDPPPGLAKPYGEYVMAQRRVKEYDREALEAAKAGDASAYGRARAQRDAEQGGRERLAKQIGFELCSVPG